MMNNVTSRTRLTGRILSGLAVAFLSFDAAMKLLQLSAAVQGTTELGYPARVVLPLGAPPADPAGDLLHSPHVCPRRHTVDRVSGWGNRHARPSQQPPVHSRALPRLRGRPPLGRALVA